MRTRLRRAAACGGLLMLLSATASEAAVPNVLLLQSLDRGNLTLDYFTSNFRVALDGGTFEPVTVTQFVVNPSGFDAIPEKAIVEYLRSAFANRPPPDLVMTTGGPAAAFARKYRQQMFPESPLLFAAVDERFLRAAPLADNEAAVAVRNDMATIVDDILQLFPQTSTVFMVSGSGPLGEFWRQTLERDFERFERRVTFTWSDELSLAEILQSIAALPPNSAIFYLMFGTDAAGGAYSEERVLADIHDAANAPLFGTQGIMLGHGIVGGHLMSIDELGRVAAEVALRILNGESPASIRTPLQKPGPPVFDSRELHRWGISESRLPLGSVVRFSEPGLWERFKWVVIGGSSVLIAQAVLIGALLVSRVKRRHAEQSLRHNVADLDTARSALSSLSRRLMETQEQERTRVARELHDDVGQRMAFLAIDVARLLETLPAGATEAQEQAQSVSDGLMALARDVQGISHRLHSSKLDLIGLSAAANSWCREVSSYHNLNIEFSHEHVPSRLPEGVGISFFRVLQEALSNAVKYAGARHCRVRLRGSTESLHLEVIDDGCGFDVDVVRQGPGLGLISMQERLKLVNGHVVIESKVGAGTTVRASAPLRPDPMTEAQAASSSADRAVPWTTA